MNPVELISQMKEKYGGCASYSDVGHANSAGARANFQTRYVKSAWFRFDCIQAGKGEEDIFYSNPDGVYYYRSNVGTTMLDGIDRAIGTASAISFGAINAVTELFYPGLMNPTTFGGRHHAISDDELDGLGVYCVSSANYISDIDIWISKSDFTVRKIRRVIHHDASSSAKRLSRQQLTCEIHFLGVKFNCPIDSDVFLSVP